jgi:phage regulator Rha-like protein
MAAKTITPAAQVESLVRIANNKPTTTSLIISEGVGMDHASVIKLVRKYQADFGEFGPFGFQIQKGEALAQGGFAKATEFAELNEDQATYLMTLFRNTHVVRSFKIKLVKEFRKAINEITHLRTLQAAPDRQQARVDGKVTRLALTDAVREFVEYAHAQGSTNARMYYTSITLMEYRALFLIGKAVDEGFRDKLTSIQNSYLATAESIAQRALREGMAKELHYKAIYALAKCQVEQFAAMVGKSYPGDGVEALMSKAA